jgi:hypothetical protein
MKAIISAIFFFLSINLFVQAQDGSEFDFWVGKWDLSWKYGDGSEGKGTNHIMKTLDGKVIQENFEAIDERYQYFGV